MTSSGFSVGHSDPYISRQRMGRLGKEKMLSEIVRYSQSRKEFPDLLPLVRNFRRGMWQNHKTKSTSIITSVCNVNRASPG